MSVLPSPVAQWDEPAAAGLALALTSLVPYKTAAGYWVFLPVGTAPPGGATPGALVKGASYDTLLTSTTVGLRLTRNPRGTVFSY